MQKRVGRYQMVEEIGKGQYGLVYKAVDLESNDPLKRTVAVKQVAKEKVHKSDLMKRLFVAEVQVMQTLNMKEHDNLLSMQDFIETGNNYYLVVKFCRDGDLETRLKKKKRFSETESVFFLKQIMNGFTELYKHKIMHRDFKLANIFLDRHELVIGDFGFAKMGQEMASTKLGTPYNMAPELLLAKGKVPYTNKTDLWSIGICFYQMLYGVLPFEAFTMDELKNEVVNKSAENTRFHSNVTISSNAKDLLIRLLQVKPEKRINWLDFFDHPIFKQPGFPDSLVQNNSDEQNLLNTSQLIEMKFKANRETLKQYGNASELLVLPDPLDIIHTADGEIKINVNMGKGTNSMQNELQDENKTKYLHERNKQISLFSGAKLLREITKGKMFDEKFNIIYIASLCQIKQSKTLNKSCINSLKEGTDIQIDCVNFKEWVKVKNNTSKIITQFEEDNVTMTKYWEHLIEVIQENINQGMKFDMSVLDELIKKNIGYQEVFTYIDDILINLYKYNLGLTDKVQNSPEGDKLLRCCGNVCNLLNQAEIFPYKTKSNDVFNWNEYKKTETALTKDQILKRLSNLKNRESRFNNTGCYVFDKVKQAFGC